MAFGESVRALEFLERGKLMRFMGGDLVDLGCGPEPVLPRALGVNCGTLPDVTLPGGGPGPSVIQANIDPVGGELYQKLGVESFDTVFSSHALEHCPSPISRTLDYWLGLVRPGGHLVLYLPDERFYRFDALDEHRPNPEHLHRLTMGALEWHVDQLRPRARIVHLSPDVDVRHGRYSFLGIVQKT